MTETNPDEQAHAASAAVDAWRAADPTPWPLRIAVDPHVPPGVIELESVGADTISFGRIEWARITEPVNAAYTTVRDQARAITAEDDVLQQCVADLVAARAGEDAARSAIATVVEYALRKGIIRVG